MELKFRKLNADEIEVRPARVTSGGVFLLLYKDARCDQNILDETVTPMRWQRHHSRDNANCVVSIYDEDISQWIEKEDTGKESFDEKEKGLASDSFKRACVNWGIGRELYTAPNLFIFKDKLTKFGQKDENYFCNNKFRVKEITYNENKIDTVTISVMEYSSEVCEITFSNSEEVKTFVPTPATTNSDKSTTDNLFSDEEIILIGSCKGKKYKDVKDTPAFKAFTKWALTAKANYPDEKQNTQLLKIQKLGQA